MTRKVIAFAGKAGSGKDYRCSVLVKNHGYVKMAFADALRRVAFATLGMDYNEGMDKYEELKRTKIFGDLTFRNILENLGTEGIRKYDNDFWVKCLINDMEKENADKDICISDLRFVNEYDKLKKYCDERGYSFELVFCDYHSERYEEVNNHASAQLANFLKNLQYEDGEVVSDDIMQTYITSLNG